MIWEAFIGIGILAMLLRMNMTLGQLVAEVKNFRTVLDDHETRIRSFEHDRRSDP